MKVRMQKYRRCGLCLIIGWVLVSLGTVIPADFAEAQVTEEWVARYDGPVSGQDLAHAIAVDAQGNVYVTGHSWGSGTPSDYATVKYDTNGNEEWVARYDGPENASDEATALAVDGDGNVYVTGTSWGGRPPRFPSDPPGTSDDYATVKYNQNTPPVADAGPDQTVECTSSSGAFVTLDGSRSSDPDGDPLTYSWTGPFGSATGVSLTVTYEPSDSNATLVVNDGTVDSDPDTVMIKVQDTTAPVVTAELVPVKVKKKKDYFRIMFSATDNCDADPDIVALLKVDSDNGVSVTNGQIVKLRHKKRFKVNAGDDDSSDDSNDDEEEIKLEVTATDDAGNVGTGSDIFVFPSRHHGHKKNGIRRGNDK